MKIKSLGYRNTKIFGAKKNKAFTLVELLIAVIIVGVLATVMFQVYITISNISVRIESEKILQSESMFFVQNLQNLSDSQQIDLKAYETDGLGETELAANNGVVDKLYFTGGKYTELFLSGANNNCETTKNCEVILKDNDGNWWSLTDPKKVYLTNLKFKLSSYSGDIVSVSDSYQQGFGVFGQMYISKYNTNYWPLNVKSDIQTFFSIR